MKGDVYNSVKVRELRMNGCIYLKRSGVLGGKSGNPNGNLEVEGAPVFVEEV